MHTGRTALALCALLVGLAPSRASAQESPDSITRGEHQCQDAFGSALVSFSDGTGACLAECETSPGRRCDLFSPDTITGDCLSRARAAAQIPVLRQCAGTDCPECYGGGLDCTAYADSEFSQTAFFVEQAIAALYCDDSSSADGLTRTEQSCQRGLSRASGRFVQTLQRCFAKCQQAVQRGTTGFSSCESAFLDTPTFDPRTQRCIDRARARLLDSCNNHCADPPDCFPYSCSDAAQLVEDQALSAEPTTYCQDVPPPVCGDGKITGSEFCDQSAFPNGCPAGYTCFSCDFCFPPPPVCGDGQITPGEVCDQSASPSGCTSGETCFECQECVGKCGNGTIDPDESCDPHADPSGCDLGNLCSTSCSCEPCHDPCQVGGALAPSCSSCVADLCAQDNFCCSNTWDSICVNEANTLCGLGCGSPSGAFVDLVLP
jgi:hypothetical protein